MKNADLEEIEIVITVTAPIMARRRQDAWLDALAKDIDKYSLKKSKRYLDEHPQVAGLRVAK